MMNARWRGPWHPEGPGAVHALSHPLGALQLVCTTHLECCIMPTSCASTCRGRAIALSTVDHQGGDPAPLSPTLTVGSVRRARGDGVERTRCQRSRRALEGSLHATCPTGYRPKNISACLKTILSPPGDHEIEPVVRLMPARPFAAPPVSSDVAIPWSYSACCQTIARRAERALVTIFMTEEHESSALTCVISSHGLFYIIQL